MMTFAAIYCLLEDFSTGMTSSAGASPCGRLDPTKEANVGYDLHCRAKVSHDPICEGEFRCWNLHGPPSHIPNSSPSRVRFKLDEPILRYLWGDSPKASPSLFGIEPLLHGSWWGFRWVGVVSFTLWKSVTLALLEIKICLNEALHGSRRYMGYLGCLRVMAHSPFYPFVILPFAHAVRRYYHGHFLPTSIYSGCGVTLVFTSHFLIAFSFCSRASKVAFEG
jgi:hypothetical protein